MDGIIKALKAGYMAKEIIERESQGLKVHSIFPHAVNFIDGQDYLVTVLEDKCGCNSQAVTVGPVDMACLSSCDMAPGEYIEMKSLISFDITETLYFHLPREISYLPYGSIRSNITSCRNQLMEWVNISAFAASVFGQDTLYSIHTSEGLKALKAAYIKRNKDEMAEALKGFVGLGQGLTPSGDDFICGVVSVLFCCPGLTGLDNEWVRDMGLKVLKEAASKTTIISYNMLRAYLKGELSEHMLELMKCILAGESESLRHSFNRVMEVGSTSGSDMASGVLFGFCLMDELWGSLFFACVKLR